MREENVEVIGLVEEGTIGAVGVGTVGSDKFWKV